MQDTDIYVKTDAGREEIRARSLGLPMSVRAILLMVDGQRDVAAMRGIIAGSKAPADVLDGLEVQGLIARVSDAQSVVGSPAPAAAAAFVTPPPPVPPSVAPPPPVAAPARPAAQPSVAPSPAAPPPAAWSAPPQQATPPAMRYDEPLDLRLPTIPMPEPEPEPPAVEPPLAAPISRYEHLYAMMNEIVRDFLSPTRRYFFQLKIERATTSDELMELLHDLQTALSKSRGDAFASEVIARLRNAAA